MAYNPNIQFNTTAPFGMMAEDRARRDQQAQIAQQFSLEQQKLGQAGAIAGAQLGMQSKEQTMREKQFKAAEADKAKQMVEETKQLRSLAVGLGFPEGMAETLGLGELKGLTEAFTKNREYGLQEGKPGADWTKVKEEDSRGSRTGLTQKEITTLRSKIPLSSSNYPLDETTKKAIADMDADMGELQGLPAGNVVDPATAIVETAAPGSEWGQSMGGKRDTGKKPETGDGKLIPEWTKKLWPFLPIL